MPENRRWLIGRGPDCDLIVARPEVSTHHCCLTAIAQGFVLEDLSSANGTFVNGRQIKGKVNITRNATFHQWRTLLPKFLTQLLAF